MAAVILPVFFLLLLELCLRVSGFGYSTSFLLAPVNNGQKTFVQNNRFGWRFFGRRKARTPAAISILRQKPPNTVRIFVFGESAAFGDPQPAFGLPRVLQATLSLRHPETKFEVVNAAMTAINSHVILPIARDCARAGGDIWVIYMGNNEVVGPYGAGTVFGSQAPPVPLIRATLALQTTRLGQLLKWEGERLHPPAADQAEWGGMVMFLNQQVGERDPRLARVYGSFEKNLIDIINTGRASGAGVVVSTVAVNLKDCAPFASEPGADGAESQFRLGRDALARGEWLGARQALGRARDLDTLRFRCDSRLNEIIRKTASGREGERVFFADADNAFAAASQGGVPGWNFFYEHVHLNFEGNCLLARTLAEQVEKLLPPTVAAKQNPWPAVSDCARRLGWTGRDLKSAIGEIFSRLSDPPFATQINHGEQIQYLTRKAREAASNTTPAEALRAARLAVQLAPDDAQLHEQLSVAAMAAGQPAEAEAAARRAVALLPSSEEYGSQLGLCFVKEEKYEEAVHAYRRAFELNPEDVTPLQNIGMALAKLGRTEESTKTYQQALAISPRFGLAWLGLGQNLEGSGQKEEAAKCYRKALANRIHRPPDLATLGRFCMSQGWYQAAATNFDEAIQLGPAEPDLLNEAGQAHFLYGEELGKSGQPAAAAGEFRDAVRLLPDVIEARLNLGIALYHEKQWNESLTQFETVLSRNPTNIVAVRYLELLRKHGVTSASP